MMLKLAVLSYAF